MAGETIIVRQGLRGLPGQPGAPGAPGNDGPPGPAGPPLTPKPAVATVAALPASGNAPGDLRTVTDTGHGYGWDGAAWVDLGMWRGVDGAQVIVSATAPASPTSGQLWYDTTASMLKYWTGSAWEQTKGATGDPGPPGDVASTDPRLPQPQYYPPAEPIAYAKTFSDGKRTFLEMGPDGKPTQWSATLIGDALATARRGPVPTRFTDGTAYAVAFADGKRSFVEFSADGTPTSWSASLIGQGLDASADYRRPAWQRALRYPSHLDRWYAIANTGRYRPRRILILGDSITLGRGSYEVADAGSGANYDLQMGVHGYAGIARTLYADRFGDIGEGLVTLNSSDRTALAGGAAGAGVLPWSYSLSVAPIKVPTGGSMTLYLLTGTTIKIAALYVGDGTDGAFTYRIDGGAAVTATSTPASGTNVPYTETITGLSNATHTLVVNGPAGTKNAMLRHVEVYKDATKGYQVWRAGWSGAGLSTFVSTPGDASRPLRLATDFADPNPDLVVLFFGTNNYVHTQTTSPATAAANLTDLTTYLTDTLGKDVLLIVGNYPKIDAGVTETWTMDAFWDAQVAVAAANPHVACLDLRRVWGATHAAQVAGGFLYTDEVHFSPLGHESLGSLLYQALNGL